MESTTRTRKHLFEELIDQMMIDEVSGLDNDIKETLEGLPTEKKRMAILSILDDNRDLFMSIKKIVDSSELTKTDHIKGVVKMLREYVSVGEVEKKKFGEVMTPISLVEEMMDTLPSTVWSNPDLKWLDPCSGVGIFSCVIVERLMDGLSDIITDEEDRYKHIVEKMLYVGELQPKNMFLFLCAFDPKDEYDLNVYTGSFLEGEFDAHMTDVWGVDKFDVVVMNPPYQEQKEGFKKTKPLWHTFVTKTIEYVLSENGYLSAVHPSGWRNVDGVFKKTQKLMLSKHIDYLEIHNEKDGLKTFGAETRYDFYCLQNTSPYKETKIKTQLGKIEHADLSNVEFIPNGMFKEVYSLIAKDGEESVDVLHSFSAYETRKYHMSKEKEPNGEFKYPCIYTVRKGDIPTFKYSNTNERGHYDVPKLVWSNGRIISVGSYVDIKGEYALTQFSYAIVDEPSVLLDIKQVFDSKRFRALMEDCAVGDLSINRKAIALFRKDFWKELI